MKIRYKLEDGALPPCYAKPGDAGADLALKLKTCDDVPCGVVFSGFNGGRQVELFPGQGAWFRTGVSPGQQVVAGAIFLVMSLTLWLVVGK